VQNPSERDDLQFNDPSSAKTHIDLAIAWLRQPGSPLPPGGDDDVNGNELYLMSGGRCLGTVEIIDCDRFVWVDSIYANPQQRGYGTRMLTTVLAAFPGRVSPSPRPIRRRRT
jgi:hypothetical protein